MNRRKWLSKSFQTALGACLASESLSFSSGNAWINHVAFGDQFNLQNIIPDAFRLCFGSCLNSRKDQSILKILNTVQKQSMIMLGDNVYANNNSPDSLASEYAKLAINSDFRALQASTNVLATWDDHDYGMDNGDYSYFNKENSRDQFLEFFPRPQLVNSFGADLAVYTSQTFEHSGMKVHVILLDGRWHRDITRGRLLGSEQWDWLEDELQTPCDLVLIGSSIQALSSQHRYESWGNVPAERNKLLGFLRGLNTPALILSGDRHFHELTRGDDWGIPRVHEFTSSGLNMSSGWFSRVDENNPGRMWSYVGNGFGNLEISKVIESGEELLSVVCSVVDVRGQVVKSSTILY